ncbi:MAG: DUF167 domain-containing protein [Planctomycetota bacterium]|jgi:uncharacterized protein (TIGR00251 family)
MEDLTIRNIDDGVVFAAKIVPGSSKTIICGLLDGMLKVKVVAAPQKEKANKCLLEFLAKQLRVKKNALSIISGRTNPVKNVQVLGISGRTLMERLDLNREGPADDR